MLARRTNKKARIATVGLALGGALLAAACDDVVKDPTFRTWCGDDLCEWKTEVGRIRKAPTWHRSDYGVEFVDAPTVISQDVPDKSPRCLEFTMVADVEPSAQLAVGVDFNHDGTIDFEQPIAATGWRESKTQVTAPPYYDGLRIVIAKKGAGRAVLAQLRVQSKSRKECTAPPVVQKDLPLGTPCSFAAPDECASGVCCDGLCAECCAAPPPGAGVIEQKLDDGTTLANADHPCASGATCDARPVMSVRGLFLPAVPRQCDPGKKARAAGAECLADDDCASNDCAGARSTGVGPRASASDRSGDTSKPCTVEFPDSEHCAVFTSVSGGRCR